MEGTENIIYLTGISRVFKIKILMGQVKRLKGVEWKQEATFIASGLSGICLYYRAYETFSVK